MMRRLRYPFIVILVVILFSNAVSAATIKSYSMTYTVDNESARAMLSMMNDWRTGGTGWYWNSDNKTKYQCGKLSALTYDYNLEQIALQRAYEVAVSFSHTRPDGSRCFSCTYNNTSSRAENIAAGNSTTSATFTQWQENNDMYDGQGHRRTMLSSNYTCVGIAHVKLDGVDFWVQEFGSSNSGAASTTAIKGSKTGTVAMDISSATFSLYATSSTFSSMSAGTTKNLPSLSGAYKTASTWGSKGLTVPSSALTNLTWKSDNTSVVKISNNSTATAVGSGSCKLTATVTCNGKSYTYSMNVSVSKTPISSNDVTYTVPTCYYSMGAALTPKPVLKFGGKTLVEGTDYDISGYSNNTAVTNYANISITGKGNFSGTRTIQFSIKPRDINDCTLASIPDVVYTGNTVTPSITLTYGGKTLSVGMDYIVSCSSSQLGKATATIKGSGYFTGSRTATFYIKKDASKLKVMPVNAQKYTGSPIKPDVTVKDGNTVLTQDVDYTVTYSQNTSVSNSAQIKITGKGDYTGSKTVKFMIVEEITYTWKQDTSNNSWVLFDCAGVSVTGFAKVDGSWYYLLDGGVMVTEWKQIDGVWYYFGGSGKMRTEWQQIGGKWYYFGGNGAMRTEWKQIDGSWYYFGGNGIMRNGWQQINGKWYFFKSNGAMAANEWCDGYWLNSDGTWTYQYKGSWHKDSKGWWFGDNGGWYAKNAQVKIDGTVYKFDSNGYLI